MNFNHKSFAYLFVYIFSMCCARQALAQKMRITVGDAAFRAMPVAVPEGIIAKDAPAPVSAAASELLRLLRFDIDLMRHFDVLPPKTYLVKDTKGARTQWVPWQNIGATALVRHEISSENNVAIVELHLDDVAQQKRDVIVRKCRGDITQMALCSHGFVDAMVHWLTGEQGIFSSRIAYTRRVGRDKVIFASDIDGQNPEKLVAQGHLSLLPAWDPSGQYLLFTSYVGGGADLFRLAKASGQITPLSRRKGLNVGAQVAPNGKKIVLTLSKDGNTELYLIDWDGSNLTRLTKSFGEDVSASFSPQGDRLVFVSSRSGSPQLYVMDITGDNVRRLTFRGTYNQEPDWSPRPDGQIAFTARDEQLGYDIFVVHPETGNITRLTQDASSNVSPAFSPDGHHIAFVSTREQNVPMLFVMDADGKNPRNIAPDSPMVETPAWGPRLGSL